MERDSLSRIPDSPAFYEERIRLLEAENKKLRAALERISDEKHAETAMNFKDAIVIAGTALESTP